MLKKRLLSSVMASIMAVSAFSVVTSADATATTTEAPVEETKAVKTKAELKAYVDTFDAKYKDDVYKYGTYAAERWLKAYNVADVVLNDASATDEEVSNAYYYLSTANEALVLYTKDQLDGLVKKCQKTYENNNILNEELGDLEFKADAFDSFASAYDEAKGASSSDSEAITNAYVNLENASKNLESNRMPTVTKTQFAALERKFGTASLSLDKYESWRRASSVSIDMGGWAIEDNRVAAPVDNDYFEWSVIANESTDATNVFKLKNGNWDDAAVRGFGYARAEVIDKYKNMSEIKEVSKTSDETIVEAYNQGLRTISVFDSFKPDAYTRSTKTAVEREIKDNFAEILEKKAASAVTDVKAKFSFDETAGDATYKVTGNVAGVVIKNKDGKALANGTVLKIGDDLTIETTTTATEKVTGTASGTYFEYVAEKPATYKAAAAIDASYTKVVFKADNATVFTDATATTLADGDYDANATYYTAVDTEASQTDIEAATQSVFTAAAVGNIFADSTGTAVAADDVYDGTPANYFVLDTAPVPASYKIATLADGTTVKVDGVDKVAGDAVNADDVIDATIVTKTTETVTAEASGSYYSYTAKNASAAITLFAADGSLSVDGKNYLESKGGLKYKVLKDFTIKAGKALDTNSKGEAIDVVFKKGRTLDLSDYVSYADADAAIGADLEGAFGLALNYINGKYVGVEKLPNTKTTAVTTTTGSVSEWTIVYRYLKYALNDAKIPAQAGHTMADLKKEIENSYECDKIESAKFASLLADVVDARKYALEVVRANNNDLVEDAYGKLNQGWGAVKKFNDELANYKYSYGDIAKAIYDAQKIVDEGKYTVDDAYKAKINASALALISLIPSANGEDAFDSYNELVSYARLYTKDNAGASGEEAALEAAHEALVAATKALEEAPEFAAGDVDGSGKVDTADALLILDYSVDPAKVEGKTFHVEAADVNGDKVVDTADALAALDLAVKA